MQRVKKCHAKTVNATCELRVGKLRKNCDGICTEFRPSRGVVNFSKDLQRIALYTHTGNAYVGMYESGFSTNPQQSSSQQTIELGLSGCEIVIDVVAVKKELLASFTSGQAEFGPLIESQYFHRESAAGGLYTL